MRFKRWSQWTLRKRMVVTVVGLAGLALLVTNIVGVTMLRSYLTDRLDNEVRRLAQIVHNRPGVPNPNQGPPRGQDWVSFPKGVGDSMTFVSYSPSGTVETTFPADIKPPNFGNFEQLKALADVNIQTLTDVDSGERFRAVVIVRPENRGYAVAAIGLSRVDNTVNQMTAIGFGVSALALLLLGFGGYQIVSLGLKPLTRMEEAASAIADGDLTRRVSDTDRHTEAGRLGLALNTMLGRVEGAVAARVASEQRLRQFLADASHELRTPLTSIRGFAELYRRGGATSKAELDETMALIEDEAARMGLLVEDLLLLAALDEERPLRRTKVDLLAVAADTVRDAHVRSPHRTVELGDIEPITVSGDEHRLRQVTSNLVANALQHTPATAHITLRVGRHEDGGKTVASVGSPVERPAAVLEVTDTGPGVPAEHAQRIFERLYRADPHRARSHGGAGLGLAIVASIVKAHGGRVELTTSPGMGSTFRIILPLA
ncbi:MAG TPA: HAMP domain-containing sensor histidine kinase [Candidatus Limnocylindrales bacterium]